MDKNLFLIELSESERTGFGRKEFGDQSPAQEVFSAIWALEGEVNGGGFVSYFGGGDGNTASFAPEALDQIGAPSAAAIVRRALDVIGAPLPHDDDERAALVEGLAPRQLEALDELDEEFMAYPDNLTECLFNFVACRPDEFGPVPELD